MYFRGGSLEPKRKGAVGTHPKEASDASLWRYDSIGRRDRRGECRRVLGRRAEGRDRGNRRLEHQTTGRRAARVEAIARAIQLLDAEIIVLTEVEPHSRLQLITERLDEIGSHYNAAMPTNGQHELGIAILWKDGVAVSDVELIPQSDLDNHDEYRKALAASFKVGNFDGTIIGLHLKSGRGDSERDDRTQQAEVIAEFVADATSGDEQDVLVVGDYNMIPATAESSNDDANFQAMNPLGKLFFISSEFLRGGSHLRSNGSIANLLDGYAIADEDTQEFVGGSLQIYPLWHAMNLERPQYVSQVSDHLPLVARFDILSADDD